MLFQTVVGVALLIWPLQASSTKVAVRCPEGHGPCGENCIPVSRVCCKLEASWGVVHAPCPEEWGCSPSESKCLTPGDPGEGSLRRPVGPGLPDTSQTPLCPDGMPACGTQCITPEEICCGDGRSCPKGLVCAPPPMLCVEPTESETGRMEEEPAQTPDPAVSSRVRTLQTPGDHILPTTAPDFTLPTSGHTGHATTTEEKEEHTPHPPEPSTGDARSSLETDHNESSETPTTDKASRTEDATKTLTLTIEPTESATESPTETETETGAPGETGPAEEDAGSREETSTWMWVAPAVAALLFV